MTDHTPRTWCVNPEGVAYGPMHPYRRWWKSAAVVMTCGYVHTKRAPCPLCACGRTHGKRATVEWSAARRKLLPALLERDPHRCAWCHDETGPLVADHILPLSRFGENHIDNLQILCWSCNSAKGARLQPPRDRKAAS